MDGSRHSRSAAAPYASDEVAIVVQAIVADQGTKRNGREQARAFKGFARICKGPTWILQGTRANSAWILHRVQLQLARNSHEVLQ